MGDERKVENKNIENILQLHAHNGSGSLTSIILNNLPCNKHIVDNNINGKGIISSRVFNGYMHNGKRQTLPDLIFQVWYDSFKRQFEKLRKNF